MVDESPSSEDAIQAGYRGSGFKDMGRGFSLEKRGGCLGRKKGQNW